MTQEPPVQQVPTAPPVSAQTLREGRPGQWSSRPCTLNVGRGRGRGRSSPGCTLTHSLSTCRLAGSGGKARPHVHRHPRRAGLLAGQRVGPGGEALAWGLLPLDCPEGKAGGHRATLAQGASPATRSSFYQLEERAGSKAGRGPRWV